LLSTAFAQPMMIDPSKMSGIPRPDPQVAEGTITVRLIRGELSNRVVNHPVELLADGKVVKTEKTNEEGRATFGGLSGGPFVARAKDGDDELTSQPMELQSGAGTRVMLVFKNNQPGAPDGVARADKSLPSGTAVVRAVGPDGGILPGLVVKIGQVRAGESQVVERKGKTNDLGEARFDGLDSKPTSGYLAEVEKDGTKYAGKPFKMPDNTGMLCVIQVNPVTKDLSALTIGQGSHFIFQITDDAVQVMEVLRLNNAGPTAIELPGGIHFPLPDNAVSAGPGPQVPPNFSVTGHDAVWKGALPPGDTELQLQFVLAVKGVDLDFAQRTPVAFAETAIVSEKIDGFDIEGNNLERVERELQGRMLVLYRGPGTSAGGEVRLTLKGLPHADARWRMVAAVFTILVLIAFGAYAMQGDGGISDKRRALEQKREHLLDELVALEKKSEPLPSAGSDSRRSPDDPKRNKKREELKDKLAGLYRDLDQLA
jgi:hypothetical protein